MPVWRRLRPAGWLHAATFPVTRADDPPPDGCIPADCSLREAVAAALATPEADLIQLQAGQYQLSGTPLLVGGAVSINGVGSDQTRLVGNLPGALIQIDAFADVSVQGIEMSNADDDIVQVLGASALRLREIAVPEDGGGINTVPVANGSLDLHIEQSRFALGNEILCRQAQGLCRVLDSELESGLGIISDAVSVEVADTLIGPASNDRMGNLGIVLQGQAPMTIRDSVIRRTLYPLRLMQPDGGTTATVTITRTRLLGNAGPISGDRRSVVSLEDVEIRDHVTADAANFSTLPAVLLAEPGPLWRIHRALIAGNRGGGTDGAAVRILAGGRVGITNSTLYDNTFRADVGNGYGHTLGIYNGPGATAQLVLMHNTLRRAPTVPANEAGSLLSVRGSLAQVLVTNSLFNGTCGFGGGGTINSAIGNIESPGDTCQMPGDSNRQVAEVLLRIGALADHGGFSHSFLPASSSVLIDAAGSSGCQLVPVDQRGFQRPVDGVGCDIGAIERGAMPDLIFIDGFQMP